MWEGLYTSRHTFKHKQLHTVPASAPAHAAVRARACGRPIPIIESSQCTAWSRGFGEAWGLHKRFLRLSELRYAAWGTHVDRCAPTSHMEACIIHRMATDDAHTAEATHCSCLQDPAASLPHHSVGLHMSPTAFVADCRSTSKLA